MRLSYKWAMPKLGTAMMALAALFTAGAQAATGEGKAPGRLKESINSSTSTIGQVLIRRDGERAYVSENGLTFDELDLNDTDEGRRLTRLLDALNVGSEPVRVPVDRLIVADGGSAIGAVSHSDKEHSGDEAGQGK
jgi:hypothetical protein